MSDKQKQWDDYWASLTPEQQADELRMMDAHVAVTERAEAAARGPYPGGEDAVDPDALGELGALYLTAPGADTPDTPPPPTDQDPAWVATRYALFAVKAEHEAGRLRTEVTRLRAEVDRLRVERDTAQIRGVTE